MFNVRKNNQGKYELYSNLTQNTYFIFNEEANALLVSAVLNFDLNKERNFLKSSDGFEKFKIKYCWFA